MEVTKIPQKRHLEEPIMYSMFSDVKESYNAISLLKKAEPTTVLPTW